MNPTPATPATAGKPTAACTPITAGKAAQVTRVLIVDDHPMVRKGLAELISHEPDLATCGEADDMASALQAVHDVQPDLVIIDVALKRSNGLELVKELKGRYADLRMLVCSMHDESLFAERALRAGAMGYINKENAVDDVVEAIRCVVSGRTWLSERMSERIISRVRDGQGDLPRTPVEHLTDRELEVFALIGNGMSTSAIAEQLDLSPKTVDAHRQKIKRKLGLDSTGELMRFAVKWALEKGGVQGAAP